MFKRIDHVEISTDKLEECISFYTDIMGFKFQERHKMDRPPLEEIAFLTLGDTKIELLGVKNPEPRSSAAWQIAYWGMAIEVDDMDKTVAYLKTKGIELSKVPVQIGKSKRAEMLDPNGLTIELRQK